MSDYKVCTLCYMRCSVFAPECSRCYCHEFAAAGSLADRLAALREVDAFSGDLAPEFFKLRVEKSARKRWKDCIIRKIRLGTRSGRWLYSYGAFKDGQLLALAKVNRAGAVYWYPPYTGQNWQEE